MNKDRRNRLQVAIDKAAEIQQELNDLESEEQEAFDNLPEGIQAGERGDTMQAAIDAINEATTSIGNAIESMTTAQGG